MVKKTEVRDELVTRLGADLSAHGFRFVKGTGAFVRQIAGGSQKLYLPIVDYRPEYLVSLVAAIRLDAVEALFNRFSGADAKGSKSTETTITRLQYFTGSAPGEYTVSTREALGMAAEDLASLVTEKILPFLDRYRDVASVDEAVNGERTPGFDSTMLIGHAMHAVVLAFLAGSDRYPILVDEYRAALAESTAFDRERFEGLVAFLEEAPPPATPVPPRP